MRRILLGLCLAVCLLCACSAEPLEAPEYPLSAESIEAAVEAAGLDWSVGDAVPYSLVDFQRTGYTVNDAEGRMIAIVASRGLEEGQRVLSVQFMGYRSEAYLSQASMPKEDWEKAVTFATLLYGGFTKEDRVYQDIAKNYETKGTITPVEPPDPSLPGPLNEVRYTDSIQWEDQLDGISCAARIGRRAEGDYLDALMFSNAPAAQSDPVREPLTYESVLSGQVPSEVKYAIVRFEAPAPEGFSATSEAAGHEQLTFICDRPEIYVDHPMIQRGDLLHVQYREVLTEEGPLLYAITHEELYSCIAGTYLGWDRAREKEAHDGPVFSVKTLLGDVIDFEMGLHSSGIEQEGIEPGDMVLVEFETIHMSDTEAYYFADHVYRAEHLDYLKQE